MIWSLVFWWYGMGSPRGDWCGLAGGRGCFTWSYGVDSLLYRSLPWFAGVFLVKWSFVRIHSHSSIWFNTLVCITRSLMMVLWSFVRIHSHSSIWFNTLVCVTRSLMMDRITRLKDWDSEKPLPGSRYRTVKVDRITLSRTEKSLIDYRYCNMGNLGVARPRCERGRKVQQDMAGHREVQPCG